MPQRLTGRLSRGREQLGDLESGPSQGMSSSMSMSQIASRGKTNFTPSRLGQSSRIATQAPFASSSRHSAILPSPNGSQRSRNDDSMDTDYGRRSPSPAFSSASAAIRAHSDRSRLIIGNRSPAKAVATPSQPRRSGSLAPSDSASATGGHQPAANSPGFIYGFGSERRVGGLTGTALNRSLLAGTATGSPYQVPTSRSPFAAAISHRRTGSVTSQSPIGRDYARSDVAGASASPARSQISGSRPGFGSPAMSRASSIAGGAPSSSLSQLGGAFPPKSRNWSTFTLAPQRSRPSTGEELMREYTAARRAATPSMASDRGSRAQTPGSVRSIQLGKRDATDALGFASLDLDEHGSEVGSAKKKQMVWDPEMGFISTEELRARQPARPVPRNEAERILDVLEGMRTPLGEARKELNSRPSTPSRLTQTIAIPLPTPSAARSRLSMETPEPPGSAGIPTRRGTRARTTQQPEEGMRAKLQRSQRATTSTPSRRSTRQTKQPESDEDIEGDQEKASVVSEDDREPTPPRRVTRGMAKAQTRGRDEVMSPPPSAKRSPTKSKSKRGAAKSKQDDEAPEEISPRKRTARGKAKAASPPAKQQDVMEEEQAPLPSTSAAQTAETEQPALPAAKKSSFQVLSPGSASSEASRQRSTLRQGHEKTSRNHVKSGKISAWDSDDEDDDADLPDASQLEKIKLPTGLFPDGFKFGGGSSASSSNGDAAPSKPANTPASDSLLGRMAGFGPPQEAAPSPKPVSAPKFSFKPAASQDVAPTASSEPKAASSSSIPQSSQAAPSKPTAPAPSNFFSAPATTTATVNLDSEKKSGPVPNFFGSANKPAESGILGKAAQSTEPEPSSGGFSFTPAAPSAGNASTSKQTSADDKPVPSFGAPTSSAPTSSFTFGSSKPESDTSSTKPAVPDFFGAKKESSTAPSSSPSPFGFQPPVKKPEEAASSQANASKPAGFSFTPAPSSAQSQAAGGAFGGFKGFEAAPSVDSSKKRDADRDEEEPAAKKTNGFSFGNSAASTSSSTTATATNGTMAPSSGFTFKKPASDAATKASSPAPFSFGSAAGGSTSSPAEAPAKTADSSSAPAAAKGGLSFNTPSSPAPFKFGQPSTSTAAPSSSAPATSSTPAFGGFGAASGTSSAAATSGGFSFNKPATDAKTATPAASTGFSFGATAPSTPQQQQSQPSVLGSGGDMMDDTSPSQPFKTTTTNGSSSGPAFGGFGGGSSAPATTTGFNFGPAAASNTSKPFAFGSTANVNPPASTGGFGQPTTGTATPFGSGFGSGQTTPAATGTGGFNFGASTATPSAPASTSGGGINFAFGASQSQPAAGSNSGMFQFGGPSTQSQPQAATASPAPFQFGAGASPNPFGGMPAGPQTPPATGGPALFNIGAGGNEPTTPGGGRQVRGLPSRRRR